MSQDDVIVLIDSHPILEMVLNLNLMIGATIADRIRNGDGTPVALAHARRCIKNMLAVQAVSRDDLREMLSYVDQVAAYFTSSEAGEQNYAEQFEVFAQAMRSRLG